MDRPELLAPAGDLEKLKTAIIYGADAVYLGGEDFSLRSGSDNFSPEDMREGVSFAHERGKKCYFTLNIYAHNDDIESIRAYLKEIGDIGFDAYLVSDPGVISLLKEVLPDAHIHISTQANTTNYLAAKVWKEMGAERIVLARELSLNEIKEIKEKLPDLELEAFVHGAMCISYSGRCLLSNFMSGRDANHGLCSHPCRWNYTLMEEKRAGEYFPVEEDKHGTYFMNSNDLCMIEHIPDLVESGIDSFKIEGRMKTMYYVATVVRAYRLAIDRYYEELEKGASGHEPDPYLMEELGKASHRRFTTGFFYGKPDEKDQNYVDSNYIKDYSFVGKVLDHDKEKGVALVEQRNKMVKGDEIEVFGPGYGHFTQKIEAIYDHETGEELQEAPHPQQLLDIKMEHDCSGDYIIRKKV